MKRLDVGAKPPFDFWAYVQTIPEADYEGFDCSAGRVRFVYEHAEGSFQHVLIDSNHEDVFMVIVLDLERQSVLGHHLLNLPASFARENPLN